MALLLLALAGVVLSQEYPKENKIEKFNACYYVTKLKLELAKEELEELVGRFQEQEKAGNRISTDMLLRCYTTISFDTAIEILRQGKELVMVDSYEDLVKVDLDIYAAGNFEITEDHMNFYNEIKQAKEDAELEADRPPEASPPLPEVGLWYVGLVFVLIAGCFYLAYAQVLGKPKNQKREKRDKRDKRDKKRR